MDGRTCVAVVSGMVFAVALHGATLQVAPDGNDGWSGRLEAANAARTDGPLASAVRRLRAANPAEPVTVLFADGVYEVAETVVFTPEDSGTEAAPVRYAARPGAHPVLRGGKRITGWQPVGNGIYAADVPKTWEFRQLFADNQRQIRARCPNVDPSDPLYKGFFHVASTKGGWGGVVGCIHNRGDWLKYEVEVPATGEYAFWLLYGACNGGTEWQTFKMDGRTVLIVDDREPLPLNDLPDTGSWAPKRWGHGTTVQLAQGKHTLVWQNLQGGGLNLDAFLLCNDPAWKPEGIPPAPPAADRHWLCIQAEKPVAFQGKQMQFSEGGGTPKEFPYATGEFKPEWANAPGAEVHIFQSGQCRAFLEILSIESVDAAEQVVHVGGPEARGDLRSGDRYFVENLHSELDSPGEWYLDRAQGQLFFLPPKPIDQLEVVAPVVSTLAQFTGDATKQVEHVSFTGFTCQFTDLTLNDGCGGYGMGTRGVFELTGSRDCTIADCRFENCGRYALAATRSSRIGFLRSTITDSGEGGVLLIDADHCEVSDCTMERLGAIYKHIGGVVLTGHNASDNVVAHNLIGDSSRYGISCKNAGFRNVIEANALHNLCTETYDTGGIEVTQGNRTERSDSIIRGNLVTDIVGYSSVGDKPMRMSWGIYLDSFAGGYTVENNLCLRSSHGVMIQGGQGNILRNNIFAESRTFALTFPNFSGNCKDNVCERNIFFWRDPGSRFGTMGKDLEKTLTADRNLFFCAGRDLTQDDAWQNWRKRGFDGNGVVADPQFRDVAQDDYAPLPGSPALALGFQPLDLSQVGPRR